LLALPASLLGQSLWLAAALWTGPAPAPPSRSGATAVLPAVMLPSSAGASVGRLAGRRELSPPSRPSPWAGRGDGDGPGESGAAGAPLRPATRRGRSDDRPRLVLPPALPRATETTGDLDLIDLPLAVTAPRLPALGSPDRDGGRSAPTRRWESGLSSLGGDDVAEHGDCWHAWGCAEHREPLLGRADAPIRDLVTPSRAEALAEALSGAAPAPLPARPRGEAEFEVHWARDASGKLSTYIYGRRQDEQAVAEAFGRRIEGRAGIQFQPQAGTDCRLQVAQQFVNRFDGLDDQLNLSLQLRRRF